MNHNKNMYIFIKINSIKNRIIIKTCDVAVEFRKTNMTDENSYFLYKNNDNNNNTIISKKNN